MSTGAESIVLAARGLGGDCRGVGVLSGVVTMPWDLAAVVVDERWGYAGCHRTVNW